MSLNLVIGYNVIEEDVREICSNFTDVDLEMDYSDHEMSDVYEVESALDEYLEKTFGDGYCCARLKCHRYKVGGDWIIGYFICQLGIFDEIGEKINSVMESGKKVKELKRMYRKLGLKEYNENVEPKYYSVADGCYSCT